MVVAVVAPAPAVGDGSVVVLAAVVVDIAVEVDTARHIVRDIAQDIVLDTALGTAPGIVQDIDTDLADTVQGTVLDTAQDIDTDLAGTARGTAQGNIRVGIVPRVARPPQEAVPALGRPAVRRSTALRSHTRGYMVLVVVNGVGIASRVDTGTVAVVVVVDMVPWSHV